MNSIKDNESLSKPSSNKKCFIIIRIIFFILISMIIIIIIKTGHQICIAEMHTSLTHIQQEHKLDKIQSLESFICDRNSTNRFSQSSTTPSTDSFDSYRKTILKNYCNIVPIPTRGWTSAKTYTEKDIAFVIFTGASFFHNPPPPQ
jgi:cell division protein FtsI/penicillin-binding protein 2